MAKLIEDSDRFNRFDIYECLTETCTECTGFYSGLGIKVRCLCPCHQKHDAGKSLDNLNGCSIYNGSSFQEIQDRLPLVETPA